MYNNDFEKEIPFYAIQDNDNPENISNGSMLRHYINVWGITEKLCQFLKSTRQDIDELYNICDGRIKVTDYIGNIDKLISILRENRQKRNEALKKNDELIKILKAKRNDLCGFGTRKVKCFLNTKIKQGDALALLYRTALECEDKNITAKESYYFRDNIYYHKTLLIKELIAICKENKYCYGYQISDNNATQHIIFFELPHMRQISWHNTLDNIEDIPKYNKEWDGEVNSTIFKIEEAINNVYGFEINKKYGK